MSVKCIFSNLFSKLSAIDEGVRSPDRSGFMLRNQTENLGTGGRKRKPQRKQHDTNSKKRCYQPQNTAASDAFRDVASPAQWHQNRSDYSPAGRAEGTRTNHKPKPRNDNKQSCYGLNYKQNCNVNKKKQQRKRTEKHQQFYRNRRDGRRDGTNQDEKKFMTQEFMNQNVLLVDGQLLCRHFLYGKCIKEDSCQLLHIQGYNDLIKEACKFYIQGFCLKGDSCIYMHKSFPCKFFHRRGKCLQEGNCRFSHDPLNDVTEKLLDEVLKQEQIRNEVTKEGEEEKTETNKNPDLLNEALRPSFYNSADVEKETNPRQTEVSVSDSAEPHSSPSDDQNHQEPVCYSVEAVLGPQLSRTFSSFSKTPGSQKSETVSFSKQSEVPYSVDAVLRSCQPVEKSANYGPSSFSTISYNPRMVSETVRDPQNKTLPEKPKDIKNSSKKTMFKSFLSSGANTDAASDVPHRSEGPKVRAAGRTSQDGELELCPPVSEAEKSETSRTEELNLLSSESSTEHLCLPECPDRSGFPSPPPSDVREFTERVAAPVEPVTTSGNENVAAHLGVHRFAAKRFADILQNPKRKQLVKSWSKTLNRAGPNETQKDRVAPAGSKGSINPQRSAGGKGNSSSFFSLFATPLGSSDLSFQSQTSCSATPPCSQPSAEKPQSNLEPTASGLQSISSGLRTPSPVASQTLKKENAAVKQAVTPVSDRSDDSGGLRPPDVSPPRETSSNSVLKTLFLHLQPYQEDGEPQRRRRSFILSDGEKEKRSKEEQQLKSKQKNRTEKNDLRSEETTGDLRPPSQSCTEAPGRSKVTRPGTTEPQVTRGFPFKSAAQLDRLDVKPASREGAEVNRNTVTPLRDLFKTLDAKVFHKL